MMDSVDFVFRPCLSKVYAQTAYGEIAFSLATGRMYEIINCSAGHRHIIEYTGRDEQISSGGAIWEWHGRPEGVRLGCHLASRPYFEPTN